MIPIRTTIDCRVSPVLTMSLIMANIAVFFIQRGLAPADHHSFLATYALIPAVFTHPEEARHLGLDPSNLLPFITNTFLHGGYLHLIFNMWTLWLFGLPLEDGIGRWRMLLIYLGAGLAGSVAHFSFNASSPIPVVGASGAIAGLLGAFAWRYPRAKVAVVQPIFIFPLFFRIPALIYVGLWFAIQAWQGWTTLGIDQEGGGIAWWAHIGGFLAGLVLVLVLRPTRTPPGPGPMPPDDGRARVRLARRSSVPPSGGRSRDPAS